MTRFLCLLSILSFAVCPGCSQDQDLSPTGLDGHIGDARITVSPARLDVGACAAGDTTVSPITIVNTGSSALFLERLELVRAGSFDIQDADLIIPPGVSREVWVEFAPQGFEATEGQLVIHSNDPTASAVVVELSGLGDAGQVTLEPTFVEMVADGTGEQSRISVRNTGTQPLQVQQVVLDSSSDELSLTSVATLPTLLQPNHELMVSVTYKPVDATADHAELSVFSDDSLEPVAVASLFAEPELFEVVEETIMGEAGQVDILWAIDFGTDMAGRCDDLAAVVPQYMLDMQERDVDFQMAVMTVYDPVFLGPQPYVTYQDPAAALTVATIIDETPHPSGTEMGLAHMVTAVSPSVVGPGGRHEGFLRPDAKLQVNFYENEDDQSPGSVAQYVDELIALKGGAENLVINCIGLHATNRHCVAAQMTGGRVAEIDSANLFVELAGYSEQTDHEPTTVALDQRPMEETLVVEIDGAPMFEGWSYDAEWNAIEFDEGYLPDPGDQVTVRFQVLP